MSNQPLKATHQQTRLYNSQLVLKSIYNQGPISRAEIARLTGLTKATVSELVTELEEKRLVEEVGRGPSAGGKAPILLSFLDNARYLIGLDLANNEFRGAVVNLRGRICQAVNLPLLGRSGEEALALVYELIDRLVAGTDQPLLGIGIGTPGLIDSNNGVVCQAVNLDWHNLPLADLVGGRYNLPVYVGNDSQVAALAEYLFGEDSGIAGANMVMIKVGRGIGAGLIINGQLFQGDGFGAGEIGHLRVAGNGRVCRCGNVGCLETVASNRAIRKRAEIVAATTPDSPLRPLLDEPGSNANDVIWQAFQAGDPETRQIVLEAGRFLGAAVANLIGLLNIRRILLVGSVTRYGQPWLEAVQAELPRHALPALVESTNVNIASLGADVVIQGASALLITNELGLNLAR